MEIVTTRMVQAMALAITQGIAVMDTRNTMLTTKRWPASNMLIVTIATVAIMVFMITTAIRDHSLMPIMDTINMAN